MTVGVEPRGFVTVVRNSSFAGNPPLTIYITSSRETWALNFQRGDVRSGVLLAFDQYYSMAQFRRGALQLCS